jgi:hypothetical protein
MARCAVDLRQTFLERVYAPSPRRFYKPLLQTINSNMSGRLSSDRLRQRAVWAHLAAPGEHNHT